MRSNRAFIGAIALLAGAWAGVACGGGGSNGARPSTSTATASTDSTTTSTTTLASTTTTVATTTTLPPPPSPHVFPIQGTTNVQYARSHHDYPAADMFAPCGSTVVAVTRGRVHEVSLTDEHNPSVNDPELRGGLSVSYVGDDLVRYYGSHLSGVAEGIAPGVMVEAGQTIGFVGDTGNAAGTGCHLHFGLSSPCGGTLRNWEVRRGIIAPQPYLDAWRDGDDVNPAPEIRTWEAENPGRC
jgi:hypothetical protein